MKTEEYTSITVVTRVHFTNTRGFKRFNAYHSHRVLRLGDLLLSCLPTADHNETQANRTRCIRNRISSPSVVGPEVALSASMSMKKDVGWLPPPCLTDPDVIGGFAGVSDGSRDIGS